MMKMRVADQSAVAQWLKSPQPAVFQDLDLTAIGQVSQSSLIDCSFLGCLMSPQLAQLATAAGCVVMPRIAGLPFDPFSTTLYTPQELFDKYDPTVGLPSYHLCADWLIYDSYMDPNQQLRPAPNDLVLFRRMHDATVSDALAMFIGGRGNRLVAIMGGHDRARNEPIYLQTAKLAIDLTLAGYIVVTGGGPGLMEAGNLGAYVTAFPDPAATLATALQTMAAAPKYNHPDWMKTAFLAKQAMGTPANGQGGLSIGIPTWFYGHEPPNFFASHVAKYFENSVREDGLLAVALGGVIFAEGNAGTVQEIFQDVTQNYYRTFGGLQSPMILLGTDYWNPSVSCFNDPSNKRKAAYALLHKLATEKGFDDLLLVTDDVASITKFIQAHPPR